MFRGVRGVVVVPQPAEPSTEYGLTFLKQVRKFEDRKVYHRYDEIPTHAVSESILC